jgi:hypothetical protein
MRCNGCGGDFETTAGVLAYGGVTQVPDIHNRAVLGDAGLLTADYGKTLCPRCQHVMKDILLSSDLSEQWDSYEWSLMGGRYTEPYDD